MSRQPRSNALFRVFRVAGGWCAVARTRRGVNALVLPVPSRVEAVAEIRRLAPAARESRRMTARLVRTVQSYFHGWRMDFDDFPPDLSAGTPFQQRVWEIVRRIPYGEARTYQWIGMEMGRPDATRAIGAAVGANPVPLLVPCHRVVAADGRLGGFSAAGGLEMKARMLELERVPMTGEGTRRRVLAQPG